MFVVNIKPDIEAAMRLLEGLRKDQVPFATALALTRTAQYTQKRLYEEIDRVFDRPTPFVKSSLWVQPATKGRLYSRVRIKDEAFKGNPAVKYLLAEVQGGTRNRKGFENLLTRAGILPAGWYAIPTSYAPFDAYGNVPGSTVNSILSQLQAARDSLANESKTKRDKRNRTKRNGRYFAITPGDKQAGRLKPGIYERLGSAFGSAIRPIFMFTGKTPKYTKRFAFYELGEKYSRDRFRVEIIDAMERAVATAR
jgi:hypothetical protein